MATTATAHERKTEFVKDVLANNELANTKAVNDAWKAAGRDGQISATLVNKLRSSLGLAGNLRSKSKSQAAPAPTTKAAYTGKKRGRKPKQAEITTTVMVPPHLNGKNTDEPHIEPPSHVKLKPDVRSLEELETEFDRLLFKVMGMGGLDAIEDGLRQTRRLLYGGFSGNRI